VTGAHSSFPTEHLRRLFRRADGTWVGYSLDAKRSFHRFGPGNLKNPDAAVFSIDGQKVQYNKIGDILFPTDKPQEACP